MNINSLINNVIKKSNFIKITYIISYLLILIVFTKIIYNFLYHGSDFAIPYKLSKMFIQKYDVFNNIKDNPLYPHSLYILFLPFTFFEFNISKSIFFFINILLLIISIKNLSEIYNLTKQQKHLLFLIAFTATPFSNLLAIGNLSLVVFSSLIFYYKTNSKVLKSIFLTIAFIKYNISFIFIIHAICKKEYKVIFYFLLINLIFIFLYYLYIDINLLKNFLDPFILAIDLVYGKSLDMGYTNNISKTFFSIQSVLILFELNKLYPYIFVILLLIISIFFIKNYFSYKTELIALFLVSALLVYHGFYDFIILLPLVAYFLKFYKNQTFTFVYLGTVLFIFYFFKINKLVFQNLISDSIMSVIGCFFLILSLITILKNNNEEN